VWTGLAQAIGLRYYGIPGIHIPHTTGFYYIEPPEDQAWMRADEYDELIKDPTAFLYNVWLPRVSTEIVAPGSPNSYRNNLALVKGGMAMWNYFMAFGTQNKRLMEESGTVSAISGIFKAPFDILADKLRGYIGLTMDMMSQPKKVLKACEALPTVRALKDTVGGVESQFLHIRMTGTIESVHSRSAELWSKLLQQFGVGQQLDLHSLSQGLELGVPPKLFRVQLSVRRDGPADVARSWIANDDRAILHGGLSGDPEVQAIVDGSRAEVVRRISRAIGTRRPSPTLRIALRGWVGFLEAASLDWLDRRDLSKERLVQLLAQSIPATIRTVNRVSDH
jgi:hypothetical protein